MENRVDKARSCFNGLDAILFCGRENVTYLSGYLGTEAFLVVNGSKVMIFTDSRNTLQAQQQCHPFVEVREVIRPWTDISGVLKELGIETIGVDSNMMDVDSYIEIKKTFKGIEITPLGNQMKYLRVVKDDHEIEIMKKAASISEEALNSVLEKGIIGRRECDIALDVEWEMRRLGASGVSFDMIVASGPRGAMPHGVASEKTVQADEPVVIDFGCIYENYCSDQTVTVVTGNAGEEFEKAYAIVRKAQALAIDALCSGCKASDIDKIARSFIAENKMGKYFGHGLGHGVGMEVHEAPKLSVMSEDVLREGMVVTVEPGVYLDGKFGIRIEDTLLVTDNSCKRITNLDKDSIRVIH